MFLAQLDPQSFRTATGDWSIVAMLLAALSGAVGACVILFRLRDKERAEELSEMKTEVKELKAALLDCQKEHTVANKNIAELAAQLRNNFRGTA